jgi:hypothetical protein
MEQNHETLKIETFLGPEMAKSKVNKITNVPVFYIALEVIDIDKCKSITRAIGRGGP